MTRARDGMIAYLDAKIAADKEAKKRRAEAGEMGIELAKVVLAYLGCTGNGWERIANTAEMNRLVMDAQSVVGKLEGK